MSYRFYIISPVHMTVTGTNDLHKACDALELGFTIISADNGSELSDKEMRLVKTPEGDVCRDYVKISEDSMNYPHPRGYERLSVACDLSFTSLQEAAQRLEPSRIYTLTVSSKRELETTSKLKTWLGSTADNPFAPYINLKFSATYSLYEWSLEADGYEKKVGSEGC